MMVTVTKKTLSKCFSLECWEGTAGLERGVNIWRKQVKRKLIYQEGGDFHGNGDVPNFCYNPHLQPI